MSAFTLRSPTLVFGLLMLAACETDPKGTDPADTSGDTEAPVDSADPSGTSDSAAPAQDRFVAGYYDATWRCLEVYESSLEPLDAETLCEDCELGFEVRSTWSEEGAGALGFEACGRDALDLSWTESEVFATLWSFDMDGAEPTAWYGYAGSWYPTAALTVETTDDGYALSWGLTDRSELDLPYEAEAWGFQIYP